MTGAKPTPGKRCTTDFEMTTRTTSKSGKKKGSVKSKATNTRVRNATASASRNSSGSSFRFPLFRTDDRLVEKKSRTGKSVRSTRAASSGGAVRKSAKDYERMPSWRELESKNNARSARKSESALDNISTSSMAAIIVSFVVVFTLYIGHVHSTQEELARYQRLQAENANLRLKLNRVKGEYDGMTGPAQIYDRARRIGLVESEARVPPVIISPR